MIVRSDNVGRIDPAIQSDPVWGIVFEVIFWVVVITVVANYLATVFCLSSFVYKHASCGKGFR